MWGHGLDRGGSGQEQVASICECANKHSDSIKCREYLDQLRTGQLVKKDAALQREWVSQPASKQASRQAVSTVQKDCSRTAYHREDLSLVLSQIRVEVQAHRGQRTRGKQRVKDGYVYLQTICIPIALCWRPCNIAENIATVFFK